MHLALKRGLLLLALGACIAFMAVLPLISLDPEDSFHDLGRLVQGLLFIMVWPCMAFTLFRDGWTGIRSKTSWAYPGLLLALAVASCAHAAVPAMALRELVLVSNVVMLACAVAQIMREPGNRVWLVRGVIIAPAVYCASLLVVVAMALATRLPLDSGNLIFGYDNIRFLNHTQTVAIPLLAGILGLGDGVLGKRWRWLAWFAIVVSFSLLVLTRGRATMVGLAAAGALAAIAFGPAGRRFTVRLLIAAVLGTLAHAFIFNFLSEWLTGASVEMMDMGDVNSVEARLFLWRRAIEMIVSSPWLGVGPMHFAHVTDKIAGTVLFDNAAHPHNIYFQVAAEYGLPAALLISGGALFALFRRGKLLRRMEIAADFNALTLGAFLACVAAAVDGMFSGNFVMPISQVWIALAAGVLSAGTKVADPIERMAGSRVLGGALALGLLAAQLWLMTAMTTEWLEGHKTWDGHDNVTLPHAAAQPEGLRRPRFWLNGWF